MKRKPIFLYEWLSTKEANKQIEYNQCDTVSMCKKDAVAQDNLQSFCDVFLTYKINQENFNVSHLLKT